jgi:hypothetical protein
MVEVWCCSRLGILFWLSWWIVLTLGVIYYYYYYILYTILFCLLSLPSQQSFYKRIHI